MTIGTSSSLRFSTTDYHHQYKQRKFLIFHTLGKVWVICFSKGRFLNDQVLNFLYRVILTLLDMWLSTFLNANLLHFETKFIYFIPTETHPHHSFLIELEVIVIVPYFNFSNAWLDVVWFYFETCTKTIITLANSFA